MTIQNPHSPVAIRIVILRGGFLRKIQLFSFFINDITPKKSKTKKKLIFQKKYFSPLIATHNRHAGLQFVSRKTTITQQKKPTNAVILYLKIC